MSEPKRPMCPASNKWEFTHCITDECALWTEYGCGLSHNITAHKLALDAYEVEQRNLRYRAGTDATPF